MKLALPLVGAIVVLSIVAWGVWGTFTESRSRLNNGWAILLSFPVGLWALFMVRPNSPRWLFPFLVGALALACEKLIRRNRSSRPERLLGLNGTVVQGHPHSVEVEVDGGVWQASGPDGAVLLHGERVRVVGNRRRRLLVSRDA